MNHRAKLLATVALAGLAMGDQMGGAVVVPSPRDDGPPVPTSRPWRKHKGPRSNAKAKKRAKAKIARASRRANLREGRL